MRMAFREWSGRDRRCVDTADNRSGDINRVTRCLEQRYQRTRKRSVHDRRQHLEDYNRDPQPYRCSDSHSSKIIGEGSHRFDKAMTQGLNRPAAPLVPIRRIRCRGTRGASDFWYALKDCSVTPKPGSTTSNVKDKRFAKTSRSAVL